MNDQKSSQRSNAYLVRNSNNDGKFSECLIDINLEEKEKNHYSINFRKSSINEDNFLSALTNLSLRSKMTEKEISKE